MPVYVILNEMPAEELNNWALYLDARPIGWREDNRTSMLLGAQGVKKLGPEIFPTLKQIKEWDAKRSDEDAMRQSFRKSPFAALLEKAHSKKGKK
jgi:hypothetical protein